MKACQPSSGQTLRRRCDPTKVSQQNLLILLLFCHRAAGVAMDDGAEVVAQKQVDLVQPEYFLKGRLGLT
jgi:hypothetical protein